MAVCIRMKRLGRTHRAFFRICAMDRRKPRDGKVLEELGTYDPFVTDTDARAVLNKERIDYWLSVGAQPSDKVAVLIKKYGTNGTALSAQESALAKLAGPKVIPDAGDPVSKPKAKEEPTPESASEAPAGEEAKTDTPKTEDAAVEASEAATDENKQEEAKPEEAKTEESPAKEEAAATE